MGISPGAAFVFLFNIENITPCTMAIKILTSFRFVYLNSFHSEMALFRNLCVNLRNYLCGIPLVRLRVIP